MTPVHYSVRPFDPLCGANLENQETTTQIGHATCISCLRAAVEEARAEERERVLTECRLMVAQVRCCGCEEFIHELDPDADGCSLCRPMREFVRARDAAQPGTLYERLR